MTHLNLGEKNLAMQGYDPIAYFDGNPRKGDASIVAIYEDVRYHFATKENRGRFAVDPPLYIPRYGGYCATGMAKNMLVPVDPENFIVQDGKLFLFYDGEMGNTKPAWQEDPAGMYAKAEDNWRKEQFESM